ncbi:class I SAM-dependent methyltransferase [Isoptericola hypogeus]|uniref:Class I SAM-dependent methyltransferase n=1 Tax=Isoptericola hypogeus TaxID=300179 RepID=A0ABN2IYB7_9MICO
MTDGPRDDALHDGPGARHDDPADGWFGESVAVGYDDDRGPEFAPEVIARTVDVLGDLAGDGPALELAVGTGRIAAPLARRGVPVHGIELSRAMAARVADKPGGDGVRVTIGDMTTTRVPGESSLVYLVFNTINNLTAQDAQVACFVNAAAHLRPGGRFVVEVGVPALRRMPPGQDTVPFGIEVAGDGGYVGFDRYDTVTQRFTSNHVTVSGGAGRFRSIPFRYVWPAELDLMARIAGMRLEHRWAGWDRSPFTPESTSHVSVWDKPGS